MIPDSSKSIADPLKNLTTRKIDTNKVRSGWPKLKKGMTEEEVRALLGKPSGMEFSKFDASSTWFHGKRHIVFDSIKHTLRYWEQ